MNEMTTIPPDARGLALPEAELISVLQSSLYPGASAASVKLVIGACIASGKDPLKKPYHIVPMWIAGKDGSRGEMRDVIMPGINDYRTDASRTGQHAGTSEPEFGPDITRKIGNAEITYPEWCRITVRRRLASGEVVEFTAVERWIENYASKKRDDPTPNAMWMKRPYGQLAKCAEAQALRKGFPEVGATPTAEEMEGREIESTAEVANTVELPKPKAEAKPEAKPKAKAKEGPEIQDAEFEESPDMQKPATPGMITMIGQLARQKNVSPEAVCNRYGIAATNPEAGFTPSDVAKLTEGQATECRNWLKAL